MKREIEFRAWDGKKMLYNKDRADFTDEYYDSPWEVFNQVLEDVIKYYELMQYTGLHDKNGIEIYEGDIVQCNPNVKYYRQVVFEDGFYYLVPFDDKQVWTIGVVNSSHPETAVIGNIYENPELLK